VTFTQLLLGPDRVEPCPRCISVCRQAAVPDREVSVRCGPWIVLGRSGHSVAHIPEQPSPAAAVGDCPAQQIFQRFLPGPVPDLTRWDVEPSTVRPSLDQDVVPTGHQETDQAYRRGSGGRLSGQYDVGATVSG
jgi:hypothetical protein